MLQDINPGMTIAQIRTSPQERSELLLLLQVELTLVLTVLLLELGDVVEALGCAVVVGRGLR
ncbi:hypothetical protein EF148_03135 [Stenotrophomonas maltophilia]|nr:hypothetical protein [Stenotrophomonas maltophilia]